jgi:hypothetical protein
MFTRVPVGDIVGIQKGTKNTGCPRDETLIASRRLHTFDASPGNPGSGGQLWDCDQVPNDASGYSSDELLDSEPGRGRT